MESKHFVIEELVPRKIYETYKQNSWWFISPRLVETLDTVRKLFGYPVVVNDWLWGGENQESGFREPRSKTGAYLSQHKLGKATDIKVKGFDSKEVYNYIIDNIDKLPHLGGISVGNGYVHIDVRVTDKLVTFK